MARHSTRVVLRTFAEKVSRLENSSLKRFLSQGWTMSWDFEVNRRAENARMPELEHLEAYILNLRFFIQNNEPTSLKNMDTLYRSECKSPELLKQFQEVRNVMNHALDRKLWFRFNGRPVTYRMLLEGMIYARFAHASRRKHVLFDQMTTHPP